MYISWYMYYGTCVMYWLILLIKNVLFVVLTIVRRYGKLLMITELQNLMELRSDVADDEVEFKN